MRPDTLLNEASCVLQMLLLVLCVKGTSDLSPQLFN